MLITLILAMLLFAILSSLLLAIWIYKDATLRGDTKKWLWILLSFMMGGMFGNVPVGIILYLVFRKSSQKMCHDCAHFMNTTARYCEHCGAYSDEVYQEPGLKRNRHLKFLFASGIAFILMVGSGISTAVVAVANPTAFESLGEMVENKFSDWEWNVGMIAVNTSFFNNRWNFNYIRMGSSQRQNFTFHEGEALNVAITMDEGQTLTLIIEQGDNTESFEFTETEIDFQHILENFEPGRLTVRLRGGGLRNVKGTISLE
ncbi:MAG: hypothetical protein FWF59_08680 [Turicibacter sp.]|nr:hypothetical protein [Turicibacter sp.]